MYLKGPLPFYSRNCQDGTYLFPAFVHAIILSKTRISWKLRKIRGKFETRNPVTMATKVIASLSSALRLRMLLLLPPGTDFKDALKFPPSYLLKK